MAFKSCASKLCTLHRNLVYRTILMQELRNDPEFKQMFEEIQKGGMGALMKYMNSPQVCTPEAITAAGWGHFRLQHMHMLC